MKKQMILALSIFNIAFWIYRASKKLTVGGPTYSQSGDDPQSGRFSQIWLPPKYESNNLETSLHISGCSI
jgi:hypothetical protein